jgi:hypothetical protein
MFDKVRFVVGATTWSEEGMATGITDIQLTEAGKAQVRQLCNWGKGRVRGSACSWCQQFLENRVGLRIGSLTDSNGSAAEDEQCHKGWHGGLLPTLPMDLIRIHNPLAPYGNSRLPDVTTSSPSRLEKNCTPRGLREGCPGPWPDIDISK